MGIQIPSFQIRIQIRASRVLMMKGKKIEKRVDLMVDKLFNSLIDDVGVFDGSEKIRLNNPILIKEIIRYVRCLRDGSADLTEVLEESYIHKNGFQKIVLGRREGFALRFHRYLPGVGDQNVHDHRWSRMDSYVIEGGLSADYLCHGQESEDGVEPWETHTYRKIKSDYVVEHKGTSYLKLEKNVIHDIGTTYSMDSYQLHRILPSNTDVATLVVTHPVPRARVWCNLYQKEIIEELEPVHEIRLTEDEMLDSLKHLETLLSNQLCNELRMNSIEKVVA